MHKYVLEQDQIKVMAGKLFCRSKISGSNQRHKIILQPMNNNFFKLSFFALILLIAANVSAQKTEVQYLQAKEKMMLSTGNFNVLQVRIVASGLPSPFLQTGNSLDLEIILTAQKRKIKMKLAFTAIHLRYLMAGEVKTFLLYSTDL